MSKIVQIKGNVLNNLRACQLSPCTMARFVSTVSSETGPMFLFICTAECFFPRFGGLSCCKQRLVKHNPGSSPRLRTLRGHWTRFSFSRTYPTEFPVKPPFLPLEMIASSRPVVFQFESFNNHLKRPLTHTNIIGFLIQ